MIEQDPTPIQPTPYPGEGHTNQIELTAEMAIAASSIKKLQGHITGKEHPVGDSEIMMPPSEQHD